MIRMSLDALWRATDWPRQGVGSAGSFTQLFPAGHEGHTAVLHPEAGRALGKRQDQRLGGRSAGRERI